MTGESTAEREASIGTHASASPSGVTLFDWRLLRAPHWLSLER